MTKMNLFVFLLPPIALLLQTTAWASPPNTPTPPAHTSPNEARKLDVDALKQRYWKNDAPEFNVVQNRLYTKSGRINIQTFGGSISHDPFLSTYNVGASLGLNFSEYIGVRALYVKAIESDSPAVGALVESQNKAGGTVYSANVNRMQTLIGGELDWGFLYGKLSLLGQAILHFDFFLVGGAGLLSTQNGNSITPWIGLGQQIYITHFVALRADFRYLIYSEKLIEQNNVTNKGAELTTRTTAAPTFNIGLSFYFF